MPKERGAEFIRTIWSYYEKAGRDLPWRHQITPYRIVISEIMLQQTQASRVVSKFESFMKRFPNWKSLAEATLTDVLSEWKGLGYNRRGLYVKQMAEKVVKDSNGKLPQTIAELKELPGIGPNTAGSILAFAFNIPHPFIETNIRSVFIHFFFKDSKKKVHDAELMPLIEKTLANQRNQQNPREWYYALMDYGAKLKREEINPSRKSKHHIKQSPFKGSNRELRAKILHLIVAGSKTKAQIEKQITSKTKEEIATVLAALEKEHFIVYKDKKYIIA